MKPILPALLVLLSLNLFSDQPEEACMNLIDGFYRGDACVVENYLSTDAIQMIDTMLMIVRMQPDQAAAELSRELQIAVTGPELANWTSYDFINAFINSPGVTDNLPPRQFIQISECEVTGDTGLVHLKIENYPEVLTITMVREGDDWKLSDEMVGSEL